MNKFICDKCIDDVILAEFVRANASWPQCSYCRRPNLGRHIAVDFDSVAEIVEERFAIDYDYGDEYDHGYNDDGELAFAERVHDAAYVLKDFGLAKNNRELFEDFFEHFHSYIFARRNELSGIVCQRVMDSWAHFCDVVKHKQRYTFWDNKPYTDRKDYNPTQLVTSIIDKIKRLNLIHSFPAGTRFWRARNHNPHKEKLATNDEFAPLDEKKAVFSNRMSPAGIPMFYGAADFTTACLEVIGWHHDEPKKSRVTAICFETKTALNLLDLTSLTHPRSLFENWNAERWDDYRFLKGFLSDVSKPVDKSGSQHASYAPTQVFTEFVRYRVHVAGEPIHGILYPSCYDKRPCVVIFANRRECLPGRSNTQLLTPVPSTRKFAILANVKRWLVAIESKQNAKNR